MEHSIEIITSTRPDPGQIKAAILDFDGTLSTLRHGWEDVMEPLMVEMICGPDHKDDGTVRKSVQEYIKESTGLPDRWSTSTSTRNAMMAGGTRMSIIHAL